MIKLICTPTLVMLTMEDLKSTWGKMSDLGRNGRFFTLPSMVKNPIIFLENSQKHLKQKTNKKTTTLI